MVVRVWGNGKSGLTFNKYRASTGGDGNILELVLVVAQDSENTKSHLNGHFKMVNCMSCEFYLNLT